MQLNKKPDGFDTCGVLGGYTERIHRPHNQHRLFSYFTHVFEILNAQNQKTKAVSLCKA